MTFEEKRDHLKELTGSYSLIVEMQDIMERATEDDEESMQFLEFLLNDCKSLKTWRENNVLCSMSITAYIRTRTPRSMNKIIAFCYELPDQTHFGAIELISTLLPLYRKIILGPIKEMALSGNTQATRAIGLQTLCNMYLEGNLSLEDAKFLEQLVASFKEDRYFSSHITDLVKGAMAGGNMTHDSEEEIQAILDHSDDFLIQKK